MISTRNIAVSIQTREVEVPTEGACAIEIFSKAVERLPRRLQEALEALRTTGRRRLGPDTLMQLKDPVARRLLKTALFDAALAKQMQDGPPLPFATCGNRVHFFGANLKRILDAAWQKGAFIDAASIDERWVAACFTRVLISAAVRVDVKKNGCFRVSRFLDAIDYGDERLEALQGDLNRAENPSLLQEEYKRMFRELVWTGLQKKYATAAAIQEGFDVLPGEFKHVYEEIMARPPNFDPVSAPPADALASWEWLGKNHFHGVLSSAGMEQQRRLGCTPVLSETLHALANRPSLRWGISDTEVHLLAFHALPSAARLVSEAGFVHVHGDPKKYSSSPYTVAMMSSMLKTLDSDFGGPLLSRAERVAALKSRLQHSQAIAKRAGRKLIVYGDGPDSAAAAHALADAYIEFTQGGENWFREHGASGLVVSLASSDYKKALDRLFLGDWLVPHEARRLRRLREENLYQKRIAVVGYGKGVGPSVARTLQQAGCTTVFALDKDQHRIQQALAEGVPAKSCAGQEKFEAADYYFVCTGHQAVGKAQLEAAPDGSVWVPCGSRYDFDIDYLCRASRSELEGVRVEYEDNAALDSHRTMVLIYDEGSPRERRVSIRNRGEPMFDGVQDKDPKLVDLYMAGLAECYDQAFEMLEQAPRTSGVFRLSPERERCLFQRAQKHYGLQLE